MTRINWWKRAVIAAATLLAVALAFKLFEPILVYTSGWKPFPAMKSLARAEAIAPAYAKAGETAAAILMAAQKDGGHPALSAAVAMDGALVWRGAVGLADIETGVPIAFEHAFRIGSTSKALTAAAVGVLMDRRALTLESKMGAIDPTLPEPVRSVTLGQAMSHRAGVRNYGLCLCFPIFEHQNQRRFASVRESVDVFAKDPLLFAPGTNFAYTSLGYNLSGLAVERASDAPFSKAMDRLVFAPLGMSSSGVDGASGSSPTQVAFYEVTERGYKRAFPTDNSLRWPSGGMLASPTDMASFGAALAERRLVSKESMMALLAVPSGGRANGGEVYAHGFRVGSWTLGDRDVQSIHHNGVAVGARSVFVIFPEERLVISLMTNKGGERVTDLGAIVDEITMTFLATRSPR